MASSFPRAFPAEHSVAALVELAGIPAECFGDPETRIAAVAAPLEVRSNALTFVRGSGPAAMRTVESLDAGLVVCEGQPAAPKARAVLVVPDACRFVAAVLRSIFPTTPDEGQGSGIHPDARVDPSARIAPSAIVEGGAEIGADCVVEPFAWITGAARIASGCHIGAHSVIGGTDHGRYGEGADAYWLPSLGEAQLETGVVIGHHVTVIRGVLRDTWIGAYAHVGNHANVGRNCRIGESSHVYVGTLLCGSAELGPRCVLGAGASVNNAVRLGKEVQVGQGAVVTKHLPDGVRVFGNPAKTR